MTLPIARAEAEPLILVVDDDRRVRELLEIAFTAHGYRVITASDGEEAVRRALAERPDLVVLDVRLPKRSGLEVCESLRADAIGAQIPIVLVSAAAENETRLQGFNRGADDYLVKPFSPRELLARVKRLLARTRDLRTARERLNEVESALVRANEDSRRAQLEAERARELRDLAIRLGSDLHCTRDLDALAERLLRAVQAQIASPAMALLMRDGDGLVPYAVRGDQFDRAAGLGVAAGGEIARMLAALARPAYRHQLERLSELEPELRAFAAARFDLLIPVRGEHGLEALVALEDLGAHGPPTRAALESLEALCGIAAIAVAHAVRDRATAVLSVQFAAGPAAPAAHEAADILARAVRFVPLPPRFESMVRVAVRMGRREPAAAAALFEQISALDATGFVRDLAALACRATAPPLEAAGEGVSEFEHAAALIAIGWRIAESRAQGVSLEQAASRARSESASLTLALGRAIDEAIARAPEDTVVDTLRAFTERA